MFNKFDKRRFTPKKIFFYALMFMVIATALSALVMYLWNAILPDTIGVKPLSFWQAAGLLLLSKILFGGFGKHKNHKKHGNRPWKDKWMGMTQEEKQEARSRWKEHCRSRKSEDNNE